MFIVELEVTLNILSILKDIFVNGVISMNLEELAFKAVCKLEALEIIKKDIIEIDDTFRFMGIKINLIAVVF